MSEVIPNYHDGNLYQGQSFAAVTQTVILTADNQAIIPGIETLIFVGSDNTTAANRTFTLSSSLVGIGQTITLEFNTGASTTAQLADSGNMKLVAVWEPVQYDTLTIMWDGTYWVELSRGTSTGAPTIVLTNAHILVGNASNVATDVAVSGDVSMANTGAVTIANSAVTNAKVSASAAIDYSKLAALTSGNILVGSAGNVATSVAMSGDATIIASGAVTIGANKVTSSMLATDVLVVGVSGTLSQAQILAMSVTPVVLVAAPGAGKLVVVDEIELFHDYATTAYADGGDVAIQYTTSATPVSVLDVAVVTATADANFILKPSASYTSSASTSSATDLSTSVNKGVEITNATGAFTGGNASNIFKYRVRYHVITVLT